MCCCYMITFQNGVLRINMTVKITNEMLSTTRNNQGRQMQDGRVIEVVWPEDPSVHGQTISSHLSQVHPSASSTDFSSSEAAPDSDQIRGPSIQGTHNRIESQVPV